MNQPPQIIPEEGNPTTRRVFVRVAMTVAGACYAAALGYPVYQYLASAAQKAETEASVKEVTLNDAAKLPAGSALMFKFAGRPAMLIHHADGGWSAFSAVCTHLGCTVEFDPKKAQITCACHGGVYNADTGANISGPPPKPLTPFRVAIVEGKAVISRA